MTISGREGAGAREIVRKENREQVGDLRRTNSRFDGSVQESLNSKEVLQAVR